MIRRMTAVLIGLLIGFICTMLIQQISVIMHPLPPDLDLRDREAFSEYVATLPVSAFVIVLLSHGVGAFAAGFACAAVVLRPWIVGSLIIGVILTGGGIMNLIVIPHPVWFAIADIFVYFPCAIGGGVIANKLFKTGSQSLALKNNKL